MKQNICISAKDDSNCVVVLQHLVSSILKFDLSQVMTSSYLDQSKWYACNKVNVEQETNRETKRLRKRENGGSISHENKIRMSQSHQDRCTHWLRSGWQWSYQHQCDDDMKMALFVQYSVQPLIQTLYFKYCKKLTLLLSIKVEKKKKKHGKEIIV